jgi:hypothetical protein
LKQITVNLKAFIINTYEYRNGKIGLSENHSLPLLYLLIVLNKPTTIKEAIQKWEEKSQQKSVEAKDIKLNGMFPPIEKMDASLSTLANCE